MHEGLARFLSFDVTRKNRVTAVEVVKSGKGASSIVNSARAGRRDQVDPKWKSRIA